ncbi:hypothetical protein GCM10023116_48120 [Kistimonas scapharcae]|uniref:YopX protein domain-containing protein n=1 Tax=Kistimonas scapharcae TaxID=1036133 RepID=A0ABP8V8G1_9GAMM
MDADKILSLTIMVEDWAVYDNRFELFEDIDPFAIYFHPSSLRLGEKKKYLRHQDKAKYQMQGEIIYKSDGAWVVDCGIKLYSLNKLDSSYKVGDFVSSDVELWFDPLFDVYDLGNKEGFPKIVYYWSFEEIYQVIMHMEEVSENSYKITDKCLKVIKLNSESDYEWVGSESKYNSHYEVHCLLKELEPISGIEY